MNPLQSHIQKGESENLEFKTSFGKETIEALCAFANTRGGTVLIGVNDKGEITGAQVSRESIQTWINQIKNATSPAIIPDAETLIDGDKTVISLSVISYPIKPISFKGKYYKRVHNANHLMDLNEIANEHLRTINLSWDFARDPNHDINDISLEKVNQFIENSNRFRDYPINDDPLTVLKKFELLRENAISFGCFLLFCNNPSMISTIDAGRFDAETIIKDSITMRNDLFAEVEACMDFVRKHISKRFVISGKSQRDEAWEYPLEAVREIIVNMIVHRDYQAQGDSTIKIFNNRMEFFNPGALPKGIKMRDILSGRLARIFHESIWAQLQGAGCDAVVNLLRAACNKADASKVTRPKGEIF